MIDSTGKIVRSRNGQRKSVSIKAIQKKFLKDAKDGSVIVRGHWSGDFVGTVEMIGNTLATFRVKRDSERHMRGDVMEIPYNSHLTLEMEKTEQSQGR